MKKINVLVIGNGAREHALAWKLKKSPLLGKLFIAPGNSGTAQVGENITLDISSNNNVVDFAKKNKVGLVVVTPDDYLAAGMVDALRKAKIKAFGPTQKAARIESSKKFAKDLMKKAKIPTAAYQTFTDHKKALAYLETVTYPQVLKASGLALGKGVIIAQTKSDAVKALNEIMVAKAFGESGDTVVIEEFLEGAEISVHAFCDGKTAVMFPSSQDHKQIFDGDRGPNTGGMGTIAPLPWVTDRIMDEIRKTIVEPVLTALKNEGSPFAGCLYPGLMITKNGPKVLEFNARFGDPETQSYMRLLNSDLLKVMMACASGTLAKTQVRWHSGYASCIVVASKGYPATSEKGVIIKGIEKAGTMKDVVVFHAGAKIDGKNTVTNGGRVLGVTATGPNMAIAIRGAYAAVSQIHFPGKQYRSDIGKRKVPKL